MEKFVDYMLRTNPEYFKKLHSGKYVDITVVKHIIANANRPMGVHPNDFLRVLMNVMDEVEQIPTIDILEGEKNEKA